MKVQKHPSHAANTKIPACNWTACDKREFIFYRILNEHFPFNGVVWCGVTPYPLLIQLKGNLGAIPRHVTTVEA